MEISVRNLTLRYGESVAVDDLDLTIADGEALVLLGQSGCGKTSTMRCVAGLESPSAGRISVGETVMFDGERGINRPPHKRNIGMVFQSYAIWPHLTVFQNVAFPLAMKKTGRADTARRVGETLDLVGLGHLAERGASMLSGGQMQRVALARSLVMEPSVLLLDEPLSNLDARLRHRLRTELRELQQKIGLTSIYVTHDQDEALALADRISMMQAGRIVQTAPPAELYARPRSASIAEFLGVANIFGVTPEDAGTVRLDGTGIRLAVESCAKGEQLRACVRAEDLRFAAGDAAGPNLLPGVITTKVFQGGTVTYRVRVEGGPEAEIVGSKHEESRYGVGDRVTLTVPPAAIQVLPLEVPR
ncbi:ABC transporter ATP-binding protein [Streptomyces xiamenensis]|uniref:ABC transporter ATP-binding protein n=1 Tax=Streptomyces xiamenensis TaxID=408015 RepID=UPI0037D13F8E